MRDKISLETIYWKDVKHFVETNNPNLAKELNKVVGHEKFKLYRVKYKFGQYITKDGLLYLPTESQKTVSIEDPIVPASIKNDLIYNDKTTPVMLILKKIHELFIDTTSRVIPYLILNPGNIYGLWKMLDKHYTTKQTYESSSSHAPYSMWNITAGARSLFMLPKISDNHGHTRLQLKYNFDDDKPIHYIDHWNIFKKLCFDSCSSNWEAEVAFFSKEWIEHLNDEKFKDLRLYLLELNWHGSEYWRNQFAWHFAISRIHNMLNINIDRYASDLATHLLTIGDNALPALTPALDEEAAPISFIEEAYINVYRLKSAPIIMHPINIKMARNLPVYYSMNFHTALELAPKRDKKFSVIKDTYLTAYILNKYKTALKEKELGVGDISLKNLCEQINFTFHHPDNKSYPLIQSIDSILDNDQRFANLTKKLGFDEIPLNTTFFNGCVQISKKSND